MKQLILLTINQNPIQHTTTLISILSSIIGAITLSNLMMVIAIVAGIISIVNGILQYRKLKKDLKD